jgi:hypothetical protein
MRSTLVALVSTIIVFGLIVVVVTNAPNWPAVQKSFFDGAIFARSLPKVVEAFGTNVALFLIAEALILVVGLVLAILRGLPSTSTCSGRFRASSSSTCWASGSPGSASPASRSTRSRTRSSR